MPLLPDIEVFVRVVDSGSFARAANRLGVTPSNVSKRISGLEAQLGTRLLNRTTRRLSMTAAGRLLYEGSAAALCELEETVARLGEEVGQPRGVLRMTAPTDFATLYLTEAIPRFIQTFPEIRLELRCTNRIVDLVEEGIDVALRAVRQLETSTLVVRRIAISRLLVLASPSYLEQHGAPSHPEDLAGRPALVFSEPQPQLDWPYEGPGGTGSVRVSGRLVTNQTMVLMEATAQGQGFCRLPSLFASPLLRSARLAGVLPQYDFGKVNVSLLYPHRKHVSPKVRAIVDFLAHWFGGHGEQDPWLDAIPGPPRRGPEADR